MSSNYLVIIHDVVFDWSTDDGQMPTEIEKAEIRDSITKESVVVPMADNVDDLNESIMNVLSDKTGWSILDFEYHLAAVVKGDENV
jgi:hypothetical protein